MLCAEIFIALKNKLESPSTWAAISGISEWNTQFPGMEDYQVLGLEDSASVTPEELNDWEPKLERFWSYLKACPCNPSEEPLEEVPGLLSGLPLEGLSESLSEPPPRSLWASPGNPVISSPILKAQMSEQMSEMSLKAPPKIEEWPLDIPTTVMITGQPPPESSSSAPNPVVTNCGKELDLLLDSKPSPFERCSPRYHLSQSPDWYRRDITPRNPLYYLTPFPVQSSSTAPIPQWQYFAHFPIISKSSGEYEEAGKRLQGEIGACERAFGKDHLRTLTAMVNLASIYKGKKQWKEAEELLLQVIQTRKRVLGVEHSDTLSSIANLQSTYKTWGLLEGTWNLEVMTHLLDRREDTTQIIEQEVVEIAGLFRREVMTLLLERRGDEVRITEEVVKAAAGNYGNGKEVMTLLLEKRGADVQITEDVLEAVVGNSHSGKQVLALVRNRRGAEVKITEKVLNAAATSVVKATLHFIEEKLGVNLDPLLVYQLFHSARTGNAKEASLSLEHGVGSNLKDIFNKSPLWYSASNGHVDIVRLLLGRPEAILNSRDSISGFTALFTAARGGHQNIAELLLEAGANPNILGNDGRTLLEIAKSEGLRKIVKRLTSLN